MTRGQVAGAIVLLGGIAFGALGGEYSTFDWWTLRRNLGDEQAAIERLNAANDSLAGEARALETDPVAQERAAREAFGMLRPGEILYRIERGTVEADTAREARMLNWVPRRVRLINAVADRTSNGNTRKFEVQLERAGGEIFAGNAAGKTSATADLKTAAEATLEALRHMVGDAAEVKLLGALPVSAFGANLIMVGIKVTHQGTEHRLFGLSPVVGERNRAAALATLDAVNRFLGLG